MPTAQIKDEKIYQKLREKGESKEKSARIANAAAASSASQVGRRGGKSGSYDDWSKQDLVRRAKEIGIKGRSAMTKAELIDALRKPLRRLPSRPERPVPAAVAARYVTGVGWAAAQPLPGGSALRRFLDQPYRARGASARGDARHACSGLAERAVASRSRLGFPCGP